MKITERGSNKNSNNSRKSGEKLSSERSRSIQLTPSNPAHPAPDQTESPQPEKRKHIPIQSSNDSENSFEEIYLKQPDIPEIPRSRLPDAPSYKPPPFLPPTDKSILFNSQNPSESSPSDPTPSNPAKPDPRLTESDNDSDCSVDFSNISISQKEPSDGYLKNVDEPMSPIDKYRASIGRDIEKKRGGEWGGSCGCYRILVVDDEAFNISTIKMQLKKTKYEVYSALNGVLGLDV
jgi:CheY-like chemotaxis protein